jgi:hypothetical protein
MKPEPRPSLLHRNPDATVALGRPTFTVQNVHRLRLGEL